MNDLENRYIVFKIKDMEKYLTPKECLQVKEIEQLIHVKREHEGKQRTEGLFIDAKWKIYEPVKKILIRFIKGEV